jgi:hypothetical protein
VLYQLSRFLYGWPFYWILGDDCEALGQFAHPRGIFIMILYSRLLIGGVYKLSMWNERVDYQVGSRTAPAGLACYSGGV